MSNNIPEEMYRIGLMTWSEVRDALKETDIILVPLGSHEQHGPHSAINTDSHIAWEITRRAAERFIKETGRRVLVAPLLPIGMSVHHMSFPGTITVKPETLICYLTDIGASLAKHGFRKIVIVNAHGGNCHSLASAGRNIKDETGALVCWFDPWIFDEEVFKEIMESPPGIYGHACEKETSILMALDGRVVEDKIPMEQEPPMYPLPQFMANTSKYRVGWAWNTNEISESGVLGMPSTSSREKGERLVETQINVFVEFLRQLSEIT